MEYWNIGIMGENKKPEPTFVYNFFITQRSIIPSFHYSSFPPYQHSPEMLLRKSTKVCLTSIGCTNAGTALCTKCP